MSRTAVLLARDQASKLYRSIDTGPRKDSIALNELQRDSPQEDTKTALSQGKMLVEVAADHLTAFAKTTQRPFETIAPWTCVRSAIESSALGFWLMDPHIGGKARMVRGLLFRHEGLRQEVTFLRNEGMHEEANKARERINSVESQLRSFADPDLARRLKRSKRGGKSRLMPSVTDIVGVIPGKNQTYRLLSGIAHAHFWALNRQSFDAIKSEQVGGESRKDTSDWTEVLLTKRISAKSVEYLSCELLDSFLALLWNTFTLYGWETDRLVLIFDQSYERMGVGPSVGFYVPSKWGKTSER